MSRTVLALVSGLALPALAHADVGSAPEGVATHDVVVHFPAFELGADDGPDESVSFAQNLVFDAPILGVTFSGVFNEEDGRADGWASDMRLDILAPNGAMFSVGGFGAERAPNLWEFQGEMSADPGVFLSTHWMTESGEFAFGAIESLSGEWLFTFSNTFGSQNLHLWSDVTVTFHAVPAPSALALMACAGLTAMRRRR